MPRTMHRVVTRRRTAVRAVVIVIVVVNRAMHDYHTTRLRHRQCRLGERRHGQRYRDNQLLHGTPGF